MVTLTQHLSGIYASKAIGLKGANCKNLFVICGEKKINLLTESEDCYHFYIMTSVYCFAEIPIELLTKLTSKWQPQFAAISGY